ncbi:hypothetical protein H4582DRAFT_2064038 [Lactarius indigo]|nr:hypothetical protein H4582DRAFT_2064038 [Lactarius indigo]
MAEVVRYAPGELIEKNAFYLELKLTMGQRDQEIIALKEANIAQEKEFDDLKARYETLDRMHRMTIEQFASEYHELKAASGNGHKSLSLVGVLPFPKTKTREECPDIVQWNREVYLRSTTSTKAQKRGETDGNATTVKKKAKAGRPPKTTDDDSHGHLYLENLDGTLISTASLRKLSSKARSVWFTLAENGEAPLTWGKVSDVAAEYYYRRVLNEPGLEFLQYCDDGVWKLREWTQQSYSGWARNHGIRERQPRQKNAQEGLEEGGLDDPKLIRLSPDKDDDDINGNWGSEGHQTTDDADNEENNNNDKNTHNEDAETSDSDETRRECTLAHNSAPIPAPRAPASSSSVVVNPFAPAPPPTMATSGTTNALTTSSPASVAPQAATVAADGEATDVTHASDVPTTTPPAPNDTFPSTSTRPRLTLKLAPRARPLTMATASVAPAEGNIPDTPPSSGSGSAAGPSRPSNQGPETTPSETDVVNIRLERARLGATNEKKRKPDNKTQTPSASTKKQKTSAALAIPSDGNSIRNICMRCWNELQPGGQGLASDFEEYFKALTDIDKEPFKKEMRAVQLANIPEESKSHHEGDNQFDTHQLTSSVRPFAHVSKSSRSHITSLGPTLLSAALHNNTEYLASFKTSTQ